MVPPVGNKPIFPTLPPRAVSQLKGVSSIDTFAFGKQNLRPAIVELFKRQGLEIKDIYLDNPARVRLMGMLPSFESLVAEGKTAEEIFARLELSLFSTKSEAGALDLHILGDKENIMKTLPTARKTKKPASPATKSIPDSRMIKIDSPVFTLDEENDGHSNNVNSVSWSPDGKFLATASGDGSVKITDVQNKKVIFTSEHSFEVNVAIWSPDGKRLAIAGRDGIIKIIDPKSKKPDKVIFTLHEFNGGFIDEGFVDSTSTVSWSPDGKLLAATSCYDGSIKIIDVQSKKSDKVIFTLDEGNGGHSEGINSVSWSPDGKFLATASDDGTVKLTNVQAKNLIFTLDKKNGGHKGRVQSAAWSPDGKLLATASYDGTVKITDVQAKNVIFTLDKKNGGHKDWVFSASWSPDGKLFASAGARGTVKITDIQEQKVIFTLDKKNGGHNSNAVFAVWSPDGKLLATADVDGSVKITDIQAQKVLFTFNEKNGGHTDHISSVAWSPDGKQLATASSDKTVKILNIEGILSSRENEEK